MAAVQRRDLLHTKPFRDSDNGRVDHSEREVGILTDEGSDTRHIGARQAAQLERAAASKSRKLASASGP